MIQLGATVLSPHMLWEDEYKSSTIAQTKKTTLGGVNVFFNTALTAGIYITLQAGRDSGWLSKTMVDEVSVMAKAVGATYTLVTHTGTYTVAFRHFDSPAFIANPILRKNIPEPTDYFTATIKLITV